MNSKRLHGLIIAALLILAAVELIGLPLWKVLTGHPLLPWLQK